MPVRSTAVCLLMMSAPITSALAQQPPPTTTVISGPFGAKADSVLSALETRGFSGVALLARNGEVVLQKGYGLANRAAGRRMTPVTLVQIGSNTKDFTAVAILQLFERGVLGLDDSLSRFFPNVPADKRRISIRMLLNHRSGLVNYVGEDFEPVSRVALIRRAMASTLRSAPGAREAYSNLGFNLLAAIVEIQSGQSFEEYLRDNIFVPLKLRDTGLVLPDFDTTRIAHGYGGAEDRGTMTMKAHAADGSWWNLRGAGGLLSTVPDMYRFMTVLLSPNDQLLKPATRDLRFNPRTSMILAGSDLVNYFVIDHEPGSGVDIIVASNATTLHAMRALDTLKVALGLASPGSSRDARSGVPAVAGDGAPFRFPDTPAGRAAASYLRAFNTGDGDVMRKFFVNSFAPSHGDGPTIDQRMERYRRMNDDLGSLTPAAVTVSAPYQLVLQLRPSNGDALVIITFNVEATVPYRLASLRVEVN